MESYLVPFGPGEAEFVEKRSRFIGQVWPVDSEEEARRRIEETRRRHHDARHNCWCYVLRDGNVLRYSDDGEPQGTAGQPMLNVYQRENVTNVLCVVTRYFGGILLGAGGLVRAYTQSAKDALDAAGISVVRRWVAMEVPCTYAQFEGVRREVAAFGGWIRDTQFGADVELEVLLPQAKTAPFLDRLRDMSAATLEALVTGEEYRAFPLAEDSGTP